jgi:hypothetical protein
MKAGDAASECNRRAPLGSPPRKTPTADCVKALEQRTLVKPDKKRSLRGSVVSSAYAITGKSTQHFPRGTRPFYV